MFTRKIRAIVFISLLTLTMGKAAFAGSTSEVWSHHIQAWESRSVEAIASDYSEESTLILNNQVFKGKKQISHVFQQLFKIFDNGSNKIDNPVLTDRFVYITWHFTPTLNHEFYGTDTFVIENGKIVLQTIASPLYEAFPILVL